LRFALDGVVHAARVTPRGKGAFDVALGDQPATQVALLALQGDGALRFSCGGLADQAVVVREADRAASSSISAAAPSSSTTSRTWRWHALATAAAMACCAPP
jgi:hypothetical protein